MKPLSEFFTDKELRSILLDNKVGENYFGHMSQQLKSKGGSAFNAINDRLVLKSRAVLAFGRHAANMLKDKELKSKQQEITQIEADWSKALKDILKSKLSLTDADADKLAREQSKNKLLALCLENGKKHKYIAPLAFQADVRKCYNRIKKLNEQDQLSILHRNVKFKKVMFSEMPSDFIYFKQYNIIAKQMHENLLGLHQSTHPTRKS